MTFTPPSDTSVIVQSRGKEPVPNWIFASLLHRRRSLLRRFTNMSILRPGSIVLHPPMQPVLRKNYWNLLSETGRNLSVPLKKFLAHFPAGSENAVKRR
jgi:hypothetical protein